MAGFGGSVKLTGESEYRKALSQITQSLRVVSSEMKVVSSAYSTNDADTKALANQSKQLSTALNQQKTALSSLKTQLTSMEAEYKKTETTHKALVAEYDKEKAKLAEIGKTLGTSSTEYKNQQKVVADLESEVQKSSKAYDTQTKALNNMRIQTANAETTVNNTAKALDKLGNEAEDAGSSAQKAGDGFTVFKGVLANLASSAIQKAVEGLKRLGTAMIDVGKQAVASQAEYEQLTGGVETLFKNSAKEVMGYADIAYKTAGMSANQYMETVTSFSASLLQGLGGDTAKAAKIADMAIIDMSDNANKMGTSMEMIQNAYQGFAKQNFTMLDNLKLGYGGTQAEMARLINETGVMGKAFKATAQNVKEVPFDKMIEAIHQVQEQMGITGTTSKEASETISGSVNSMKAAWQNLLTGMANSQLDRGQLVKNFTDSIKTAAKNLIPTVRETIKGLVNTAQDLLNTLMGEDAFHFDGEAFVRGIEDAIKKVITVFKWFIDNRDLVISAIKGILAAFVAVKIATFITDIMSAVTTLKTMITATKGVTGAMQLLNTTMAVNPFALIAGLVAGLGVALFSMAQSADTANKAHEGLMSTLESEKSAIESNVNSWDELKKAQQEQIDAGMTEISYCQRLYDELMTIVDANGKVKEGYEGRASFIVGELKKGLGLEIEMDGQIVKGYKEISKGIDEVIQKKKAQIILNAQEAAYAEAIEKSTEAVRKLNEINDQRKAKEKEISDQNQMINSLMEQGRVMEATRAMKRLEDLQEELSVMNHNYSEQDQLVQKYYYNISQYEDNAAKFHEGKYNEMNNVTWDYVNSFRSAEDQQKAMLEDQVTTTQASLDKLNQMYTLSGDERLKGQIQQKENELKNLNDQMKQYTSATDQGLKETNKVWNKNIAEQLSSITGKNVEFKEDGKGNVQAYVDGVATGEKSSKDEMAKVVKSAIAEASLDSYKQAAKGAGENVIDGVNNGVSSQNKQNSVFRSIFNFGSTLLSKLRASLQEHSPSKASREMGQYLLQGLGIGIEDEEDSVLKQVTSFGDSVVDALNGSLEDGVSTNIMQGLSAAIPSNISVASPAQVAQEAEIANSSLVSQFKQALSEMKIEMDDQEMGRFVDNTVTRLVYN